MEEEKATPKGVFKWGIWGDPQSLGARRYELLQYNLMWVRETAGHPFPRKRAVELVKAVSLEILTEGRN